MLAPREKSVEMSLLIIILVSGCAVANLALYQDGVELLRQRFVASLQDDYFGYGAINLTFVGSDTSFWVVCAKPPSIQSLMYNYREDLQLAMDMYAA